MTRYDRRLRAIAIALSMLAGYIDVIGFMATGGFFVSFMSGNSTRLGVGIAHQASAWMIAGGLIALFVCGVTISALIARRLGAWQRAGIVALVALLLALAALFGHAGQLVAAIAAMVLAMASSNNVFVEGGEVSVGITYMTGTLVKTGQHIAAALSGGPAWAWLPYLTLWLGLVSGGVLGAFAYPAWGLAALWPASAWAAGIALILASRAVTPKAA